MLAKDVIRPVTCSADSKQYSLFVTKEHFEKAHANNSTFTVSIFPTCKHKVLLTVDGAWKTEVGIPMATKGHQFAI